MATSLIWANWGPLSSVVFFFFFLTLALAYFAIGYTHRTTVVLWYSGLCDIRVLFIYDACQCAWRIAPIRFNSVSLCPLIVIPNISFTRPAASAHIETWPLACQLHALTTTLYAPLVMKFQM